MTLPVVKRITAVRIAAMAAAILTASTAAAQYDYAQLLAYDIPSNANSGARVAIETDVLSTETCSNHVNHEMWYLTSGTSSSYWIEVGFKAGDPGAPNASCVTDPTSSEFWCDARPNTNSYYNCHFYGYGWNYGNWYLAQIDNIGSCTWAVSLGGVQLGTSSSNCAGTGRWLQAGIEHYYPNNETDGAFGFLTQWAEEESPTGGPWISTWDGYFVQPFHNNSGEQQPYVSSGEVNGNPSTGEGSLQ